MTDAEKTPPPEPMGLVCDYTFVLRMDDRPGAMELVAATFAHRGISLSATLGNDGTMAPDRHAVVLVHFRATPPRKEALKRTLTRLSRVRSLVEHAPDSHAMRQCALVRCRPGTEPPNFPAGVTGTVEHVSGGASEEDATFALMGHTEDVHAIIEGLRQAGSLIAATHAVVAL